jgi:phosphatidylserine/phosphatidylglycerophosphate/cardiolipin synthase-like enzyme
VTIDGRVAYVGSMDISTFQDDRWDTGDRPLRFGPGWHDVQVLIEGQVIDRHRGTDFRIVIVLPAKAYD